MSIDYINKLVKKGVLPKELKAEYKTESITFKDLVNHINEIKEALPKNADQGDYIDDFEKSDAPQFKGKSKQKRKDMAIAAYLSKNETSAKHGKSLNKEKDK